MDYRGDGITMNIENGPILYVTYTTFPASEYTRHFEAFEQMLVHGPRMRFAVILDIRQAQPLDAKQRQETADFWQRTTPLLDGRFVAMAYLTDSLVIRGILQAIHWLKPPPVPTKTLADPEKARAWLLAQLDDARQLRSA